ncbi:NmrA family NAD(P)-binding protein [Methylobacillus gramineus]|uniref:SDR family oxidoreductase n=1 Tax=Methylobacillus gramineus TaxID=755169 RepID=UPI001CFFDE41|nr:NmrA family NAD(P)-binding protein [Methylobacillus gramineus]MCB5183951.1 NmrA family NAD(P)-binding protein [Methylobacillus gramineus]
MTYVIHGATGAQGAPLLARLIDSGHHAVAAVRNTAAVKGMPTVAIDNTSVDLLAAAYEGAKGVFIHLPMGAETDRLQYARNIAQAIARVKPQRVVISTSGWVIDEPNSPLQNPSESAIATLIREVQQTGVSLAVVAPRLFFENLLNPVVLGPVKSEGVLRYPLRADYPVSWSSHLDVAAVAERLLLDTSVTGIIGVGQSPGITGQDLAEGFARYLGRPVVFSSVAPAAFGDMIVPLFGAGATAGIVAVYQMLAKASANVIAHKTSAQGQLALTPRTMLEWLDEISA